MFRNSFWSKVSLALVLAGSKLARAEGDGASAEERDLSETVVPPRVLWQEPTIAPGSLAAGDSLHVGVELVVEADGSVSSPRVLDAPDEAFEAEALRAAALYRFAPALRAGTPVSTRIQISLEFQSLPEEAEGSADPSSHRASAEAAAEPLLEVPASEHEVVVQGELNESRRLEKSAEAVTIVRLEEAKKRTADMGEVLARTPGMVVSRTGGLGSDLRLSINGLVGSAVRVFVDGVPIEMSGYPRNVGGISVNMIDLVEIYRGVVPLRLAADALGGAINLVSDRMYRDRLSLSYQEGSFGTYRGTLLAQHRTSGDLVVRLSGYADRAKNDYLVDVQVPNDKGQLSPARVPLQNNEYSAIGGNLEAGIVDQTWARRLLLRGFYSSSAREYGSNLVMSIPYGEVREGQTSGGGQVVYEVELSEHTRLEHVTNYTHAALDFLDVSEWVYDWYGERVRGRRVPGEIESRPYDLSVWDDIVFSRTLLEWSPVAEHALLANVTPKFSTRTGDERRQLNPDSRDPLTAVNDVFSGILGVGHEWNALRFSDARRNSALDEKTARVSGFRLQNLASVKSYVYALTAEEPLPGGEFQNRDRALAQFGFSDALRYSFDRDWSVKASYEYATRLPDSWEVFGNGALVQANLELEPETSHNFNVGPIYDVKGTKSGDWMIMLNGGLRDADNMIVLLGNDRFYSYQNVYHARSLFAEGALRWVSPRRYVTLDSAFTADDVRNQSDAGTFADFKGDRIPNRAPFSTSWTARLAFEGVFLSQDRIEPFYSGRFMAGFYRGWESQGLTQYKQRIDDQLSHDAGVSYTLTTNSTRITNTLEVQNFTDEKLNDFYGQQRPGRAVYWKLMADFF